MDINTGDILIGWRKIIELCANSQELILGIGYDPVTKEMTARTESGKVTINITQS